MYVLATNHLYNQAVHGPGGPDGYFLVDTVWSMRDFMRNGYKRRAQRHHLQFDIVKLTRTGEYYTCVLVTTHLRRFQRKFRQRH